jgi:signal transduction histidine kinase
MQAPTRHRPPDHLAEILRAYRVPTLIIGTGLVLAVICFQIALRYNMDQSERAFFQTTDQIYRTFDRDLSRHEQQITSISKMIGQIEDLKKTEFLNISRAFADGTYFTSLGLYKDDEEKGLVPVIDDSRLPQDLGPKLLMGDRLRTGVNRAARSGETYLSAAFRTDIDGNTNTWAIVASQVPHQTKKNFYLIAVLDASRLFQSAFGAAAKTYNIRIYDVVNGIDRRVIYEQYEPGKQAMLSNVNESKFETLHYKRTRKMYEHAWDVHIYSSMEGFVTYVGIFPWITFMAVLMVTSLVGFIVFRTTIDNVRIRMIVEQQTRSLRQYTERLEASNRDLDDFAYIASHDLKEPLRGLHNYSEFLLEDYRDKLDDEGVKKLETLKKLSRRMETLIETLLEYSRIGREDTVLANVNTKDMVDDVLDTLSIMADTKKVNITVSDKLPTVACDPARVSEVFRNLITNALKYNNKTYKMVEIGVDFLNDSAPGIPVFYVKDNGIGIPAEHRGTIFKIFRRLHGRDEYGGGTGSGLTIVKKIIDRHGGRIWVQSQEGEGTTFFFTLEDTPHAGN